jgi:hypothetical protein
MRQSNHRKILYRSKHSIALLGQATWLVAATSFVKLAMSTLQHQRIGEKVLSRTRAFGKVGRREVKQWIIGRKPPESHSCPFITRLDGVDFIPL